MYILNKLPIKTTESSGLGKFAFYGFLADRVLENDITCLILLSICHIGRKPLTDCRRHITSSRSMAKILFVGYIVRVRPIQ